MMHRRNLLAASAALLPWPAFAHGPSRQKVTEKVDINASSDKVWAVIGNFQDMSWHPAFAKTEGSDGNIPDKAVRKLTLQGGGVLEEMLVKYSAEDRSYGSRMESVDVKVLPVNNYSSQISVSDAGGGKSSVEWRGAFYRGYPNNDPPPELSDEAAIKAVSGLYRAGLDALKKKLEQGS